MGGAIRHISHLYEDYSLSFQDLFDIFTQIRDYKIDLYEKIDGMQVSFRRDPQTRRLLFARGVTDMRTGGLERFAVSQKFSQHPRAQQAMLEAFDVLDRATANHSNDLLTRFFPAGQWHSIEVVYPENANVIRYGKKALVFHDIVTTPDGSMTATRTGSSNTSLSSNLKGLAEAISGSFLADDDWTILDQNDLRVALDIKGFASYHRGLLMLRSLHEMADIPASYTIKDFAAAQLQHQLVVLPPYIHQAVVSRVLLGSPGIPEIKSHLKKNGTDNAIDHVSGLVNDTLPPIVQSSLRPLQQAVQIMAQAVIEGTHSQLGTTAGSADEIDSRLMTALSSQELLADPKMRDHIDRLSWFPKGSRTLLEGVVFKWNGKLYKLTGRFAAVNQLLGFEKYRRAV